MTLALVSSPQNLSCNTLTSSNENAEIEAIEKTYEKFDDLVETLKKGKGWMTEHLVQFQGFWLSPSSALKGVLFVQNHFKPQPSDIFLATSVKCGTTWFRALIYATMNRSNYSFNTHPLLYTGPHDCFPFLDAFIYQDYLISHSTSNNPPSPRLFATHIPYELLPKSMATSGCKFVHICREPKDVLVSTWLFMNKLRPKHLPPLSLDEAFQMFCEGVSHYGPYWDHVLGYWKASLEFPDNVLFIKYEDMKKEPLFHLKKLALFLGKPFTEKEEKEGVVQEILKLCSFDNLSNLEVNKTGILRYSSQIFVNNCYFFRKGEVGDWQNYLTDETVKQLDLITKHKLKGSGLTFGSSDNLKLNL
ncbi:Sulfotransferase [Heracleum sosnowskyi]|uniref:Sulfotransferase n=1 Tax=Heracleum sosnowskyi TaxID=360622 RepID=A0AAD8HSZ3_9APIA|nr:Sulfotransferase [Heracleum sosnowskyi]